METQTRIKASGRKLRPRSRGGNPLLTCGRLIAERLESSNRATFEARDVVREYASQNALQKPEQAVLNRLGGKLESMRMLDIGVGGGRTTRHFAPLTKEYVGIDYSYNMVRTCRQRFPNAANTISFLTCDARDMRCFANDYFDFVLFSFNGLDYLDERGRLEALREIKRVCKTGSFFCFSSHNLNAVGQLFSMNWASLYKRPARLFKRLGIRLLNPSPEKLDKMSHVIINDGTHQFGLRTYYVRPEEQLKQLTGLGFGNIRVFSLNGSEVDNEPGLRSAKDDWLYYLCHA